MPVRVAPEPRRQGAKWNFSMIGGQVRSSRSRIILRTGRNHCGELRSGGCYRIGAGHVWNRCLRRDCGREDIWWTQTCLHSPHRVSSHQARYTSRPEARGLVRQEHLRTEILQPGRSAESEDALANPPLENHISECAAIDFQCKMPRATTSATPGSGGYVDCTNGSAGDVRNRSRTTRRD